MNEATLRNLSISELLSADSTECALEIYRRLQDDPNYVTDISDYYTQDEFDSGCKDEYDEGIIDGKESGINEGKNEGYKLGYDDAKEGKEFDKEYE